MPKDCASYRHVPLSDSEEPAIWPLFSQPPFPLSLPLFITARVLYFDQSLLHHWLSLSLSGCFRFRNAFEKWRKSKTLGLEGLRWFYPWSETANGNSRQVAWAQKIALGRAGEFEKFSYCIKHAGWNWKIRLERLLCFRKYFDSISLSSATQP